MKIKQRKIFSRSLQSAKVINLPNDLSSNWGPLRWAVVRLNSTLSTKWACELSIRWENLKTTRNLDFHAHTNSRQSIWTNAASRWAKIDANSWDLSWENSCLVWACLGDIFSPCSWTCWARAIWIWVFRSDCRRDKWSRCFLCSPICMCGMCWAGCRCGDDSRCRVWFDRWIRLGLRQTNRPYLPERTGWIVDFHCSCLYSFDRFDIWSRTRYWKHLKQINSLKIWLFN